MNNNGNLTELYRKIDPLLYVKLVLVILFPVLATKYFTTQDGPNHLYNGPRFLDYLRNYNTDLNDLYYKSNKSINKIWCRQ